MQAPSAANIRNKFIAETFDKAQFKHTLRTFMDHLRTICKI